jgi:hypothetical protein
VDDTGGRPYAAFVHGNSDNRCSGFGRASRTG